MNTGKHGGRTGKKLGILKIMTPPPKVGFFRVFGAKFDMIVEYVVIII